jgi:hypothetical protein
MLLALIVLLVFPLTAAAKKGKGIRVNWTFSGAAIQNLAKADEQFVPDLVTGRGTIIHVQAKGSPGAARIVGLNQGFAPGSVVPADDECFDDAELKIFGAWAENSLVALFEDLSVLNMLIDGPDSSVVCVDTDTGAVEITVPIVFNGGFGRFAGATGHATIWIRSAPVGLIQTSPGVFAPSTLISEVGTFRGRVYVKKGGWDWDD